MKKSTKGLLIAAGVTSVVAVGTVLAVSRVLVNAAVRRQGVKLPPRLQARATGGLTEDPKLENVKEASQIALALDTETVKITSRDGLNLTGHLYHCNQPKRIIIAMHGWRSNWHTDFGSSIGFLHDEGCIMLCPDQRGQNDSEGEYIGFGVLERNDCIDWLQYTIDRFGTELPIYLSGVSMGSTTVLMASGSVLPNCVKGIIADCGFTSPHEIWKHVLDNNLKIGEKLTYPIANAILKREAQYDGDEYSTLEALATNTKPVLFIHGSDDTFVPLSMTFENYLACNAPKQLFIVPGAGHGLSYLTDTPGYQKTVRKFFRMCEGEGFTSE